MHFLKEVGLGPFVRADAGLSKIDVSLHYVGGRGIDADSAILASFEGESDYGYGLLVSSGIAFRCPIYDEEGKVLLNVNYSFRRVEGENYKILSLSIGYFSTLMWNQGNKVGRRTD